MTSYDSAQSEQTQGMAYLRRLEEIAVTNKNNALKLLKLVTRIS
jgi:hypothetical protein